MRERLVKGKTLEMSERSRKSQGPRSLFHRAPDADIRTWASHAVEQAVSSQK
jgi:hypothetical protein